jgi:hypothetical protein
MISPVVRWDACFQHVFSKPHQTNPVTPHNWEPKETTVHEHNHGNIKSYACYRLPMQWPSLDVPLHSGWADGRRQVPGQLG